MNKKVWICLIAVLFSLCCAVAAGAEVLTGMIMDAAEEGFELYSDAGFCTVSFSEDTRWDVDSTPGIGDVITVHYTESSDSGPLHAEMIIRYGIRGIVLSVEDENEAYVILLSDGDQGTVRVNLGDIPAESIAAGESVTVFYNGMQTRSIPPQILADYIRGTELRGTITDISEDGDMILTRENGEQVFLHVSGQTVLPQTLKTGSRVRVSVFPQIRLSIPAQYEVQDILPIIDE